MFFFDFFSGVPEIRLPSVAASLFFPRGDGLDDEIGDFVILPAVLPAVPEGEASLAGGIRRVVVYLDGLALVAGMALVGNLIMCVLSFGAVIIKIDINSVFCPFKLN